MMQEKKTINLISFLLKDTAHSPPPKKEAEFCPLEMFLELCRAFHLQSDFFWPVFSFSS